MNKVKRVEALTAGRVFIEMNDGRHGEFDVTPYMGSEFFAALKDDDYFRQVTLFFSGIGWPGGQDIGPDTIEAELINEKYCA